MIAHRPTWQPNMGQAVVTPVTPVTTPVVTTAPGTVVPGTPVPEGLFWTAVAGAAAYAGIYTGIKEKKGFVKYVGWVGGVGAGLAALAGLTSVLAPSAARQLPIRWYFM